MSRRETLLGIYAKPSRPESPAGSSNERRGPRKLLTAATALASLERRAKLVSQVRDECIEKAADFSGGERVTRCNVDLDAKELSEGESVIEKVEQQQQVKTEAPKSPASIAPDLMPGTPRDLVSSRASALTGSEDSSEKPSEDKVPQFASNVEVVLSLYGDGFLEIPPNYGAEFRDGFSLAIRVFKAADIETRATHSDKEESRHTNPGLNDAGEFVRWTCCGSTDPSIYGCSAKRTLRCRTSTTHLDKDAPAPKLIACKLLSANQQGDAISFLVYDRGAPVQEGQHSLDSGCHVWSKERECCAMRYSLPTNRWVLLFITFDHLYLRVYIDNRLVDSASVKPLSRGIPTTTTTRTNSAGQTMWAIAATSNPNSIYIGGHPSYARSVREWRKRIGFVGLVASVTMWKIPDALCSGGDFGEVKSAQDDPVFSQVNAATRNRKTMLLNVVCTGVGRVKDYSWYNHAVNVHRSVFWRKEFPPIPIHALLQNRSASDLVSSSCVTRIDLLDNFFDTSHNDKAVTTSKTFENLLLFVIQTGDVRVLVNFSLNFDAKIGSEHGCRTKKEYELRALTVIRELEAMSPLLTVQVNEDEDGKPKSASIGSFEITLLLVRDASGGAVIIPLHSMASTLRFPNTEEIKKKIRSVIFHEAKRSPGESIHRQAFRYFLSLAARSRSNRERSFLEAVITRKVVLTERKVVSAFERIGFCFADSELPGIVQHFKSVQDDFLRKQGRIEDLPTMSMLSPTPDGLYTLPVLESLSVCTTVDCDENVTKSPWRFVSVLVDHEFQLIEFIHEDYPVTQDGMLSLHQTRYLHGGFVHRVDLKLSGISSRVFCILFCLQKIGYEDSVGSEAEWSSKKEMHARTQVDNGETHQSLGMFDTLSTSSCRWFALTALYRSKKTHYWKVQALTGSSQASSIHAGLQDIHKLLMHHAIIQNKEGLQQNPLATQESKIKRQVQICVINEQTVSPVEKAHVFIEKNMENAKYTDSLAKKIVPTLTMGSRLVSIRRRLQMKRIVDDRRAVVTEFVDDVITMGTKLALISLRRDAKLLPFVRSRAIMKRAMRRRYERTKEMIMEQVQESERSRIYSRNGPIRLQQAFQRPLLLSPSEKKLLEQFAEVGIDALKLDGLFSSGDPVVVGEGQRVFEVWRTQRIEKISSEDPQSSKEAKQVESGDKSLPLAQKTDDVVILAADPSGVTESSLDRDKELKFCYVTDSDGKVTCRLTPGTYSIYIFHFEYFEWTSSVVVYPSASHPGSQSGTSAFCTAPQEILVPLEAYRWTYTIQLVDFYQQQNVKLVAGIPIQIIDKYSSQQYIVKTDQRGCAAWEVAKGLYSVRALKDCPCILYSASKNVVVDGGRHQPAKIISIPVLLGKRTVEFVVAAAVPIERADGCPSLLASIRFKKKELELRPELTFDEAQADLSTRTNCMVEIGSSLEVSLRLGNYDLEVSSENFVPANVRLTIGWDTSEMKTRFLTVLNPLTNQEDTSNRIVFSYLNAVNAMDAIIDVFKDEILVNQVWRQSPGAFEDHVFLEHIGQTKNCEFHTFKLVRRKGWSYRCKVASTLSPSTTAFRLRPRVQVFSGNKLVHECSLESEEGWKTKFYWIVCGWDARGEFIALS